MKYDNLRAFEKHLEAAGSHLSHLYLLLSKESDHKDPAEKILKALFPDPKERHLAFKAMEGSSVTVEQLASELQSANFFAEKQAFWIKNTDKCKKEVLNYLEEAFVRIPASHYLILSAPSWNKQTKFYKTVEKEGVICEEAEVKPWEKEKQLIEWVNQQLAVERKTMPYAAIQELVKQTGGSPALLKQELAKLFTYALHKKEITFQDAAQICTFDQTESIWLLGETLFRHEAAKALKIGAELLTQTPLLVLLRQIRSQFQTHFQMGVLLERGQTAQEAAVDFPYLKGTLLNKTIEHIRFYGVDALKRALLAIDETEGKAKNAHGEDKLLLEMLLIKLTQRKK